MYYLISIPCNIICFYVNIRHCAYNNASFILIPGAGSSRCLFSTMHASIMQITHEFVIIFFVICSIAEA